MMNFITPYNSEWIQRFRQISEFLKDKTPESCIIHHVGSTSIPGMPAKDIIDLIIECPLGAIQKIINDLGKAGYFHKGDLGLTGREAFKPGQDSKASTFHYHHLYACESGNDQLNRQIAFRDYLISHPRRAKWLADKKIDVDRCAISRDEYID